MPFSCIKPEEFIRMILSFFKWAFVNASHSIAELAGDSMIVTLAIVIGDFRQTVQNL